MKLNPLNSRRRNGRKVYAVKRSFSLPGILDALAEQRLSANEKKRLLHSVELKDTEIEEAVTEDKELMEDIRAAIPVITAIRQNKKLWALVPEEMKPEVQEFYDQNCA